MWVAVGYDWVGVGGRRSRLLACKSRGSLYTQTTGGFHGGSASDDGGDMDERATARGKERERQQGPKGRMDAKLNCG